MPPTVVENRASSFVPENLSWTEIVSSAPWNPWNSGEVFLFQNKLWKIGGVNDVWFSEDGITWQKTARDPQWTGREDFFSAVFKDKIWVFGGMDSSWQWRNDVWASEFLTL